MDDEDGVNVWMEYVYILVAHRPSVRRPFVSPSVCGEHVCRRISIFGFSAASTPPILHEGIFYSAMSCMVTALDFSSF